MLLLPVSAVMTQTGIEGEIFLSVINLYFMSNKELRANEA